MGKVGGSLRTRLLFTLVCATASFKVLAETGLPVEYSTNGYGASVKLCPAFALATGLLAAGYPDRTPPTHARVVGLVAELDVALGNYGRFHAAQRNDSAAWAFAVDDVTRGQYVAAQIEDASQLLESFKGSSISRALKYETGRRDVSVPTVYLLPVPNSDVPSAYGVVGVETSVFALSPTISRDEQFASRFNLCQDGAPASAERVQFYAEKQFVDDLKEARGWMLVRARTPTDGPRPTRTAGDDDGPSLPEAVVERVLAHEIAQRVSSACSTWACRERETARARRLQSTAAELLREVGRDIEAASKDALPLVSSGSPSPASPEVRAVIETARFIGVSAERLQTTDVSRVMTTLLKAEELDARGVAMRLGEHVGVQTVGQLEQLAVDHVSKTFGPTAVAVLRDPVGASRKALLTEVDTAIRGKAEGMLRDALQKEFGSDVLGNLSRTYGEVQQAAELAGDLQRLLSGDATEATLVEVAYKTLGMTQFGKQALSAGAISPEGLSSVMSGGATSLIAAAVIMQQNQQNHAAVMAELAEIKKTLEVIQADIKEIKASVAALQKELGDFRAETTRNFATLNAQLDALSDLVRNEFRANTASLERAFAISRGQADYLRDLVTAARAEQRAIPYEVRLSTFADMYRRCIELPAAGLPTSLGPADCVSAFKGHVDDSFGQALSGSRSVITVRTASDDFPRNVPYEAHMGTLPKVAELLPVHKNRYFDTPIEALGPIPNSVEWSRGNAALMEYIVAFGHQMDRTKLREYLQAMVDDGNRIQSDIERLAVGGLPVPTDGGALTALYRAFIAERGWDYIHQLTYQWHGDAIAKLGNECRNSEWSAATAVVPEPCLSILGSQRFMYSMSEVSPEPNGALADLVRSAYFYKYTGQYFSEHGDPYRTAFRSWRTVAGEDSRKLTFVAAVANDVQRNWSPLPANARFGLPNKVVAVLINADGTVRDPRPELAALAEWFNASYEKDVKDLTARLRTEFESNSTWVAQVLGMSRLNEIAFELMTRTARQQDATIRVGALTRAILLARLEQQGFAAFIGELSAPGVIRDNERGWGRTEKPYNVGSPWCHEWGNTKSCGSPRLPEIQRVVDQANGLLGLFGPK